MPKFETRCYHFFLSHLLSLLLGMMMYHPLNQALDRTLGRNFDRDLDRALARALVLDRRVKKTQFRGNYLTDIPIRISYQIFPLI